MGKINPKDYVVKPGTGIEDVDLDETEVFILDGERLTDERAEEITERVFKAGRPSLTGEGERSPQIGVRLPKDMHDRLSARAASEGRRKSDLVREAVESYLDAG